jgi:alcohol dehydrogenase class IV
MSNLAAPIELIQPAAIAFGSGTVARVAQFAREMGAKHPLVIADAFNAARVDLLVLTFGGQTITGVVGPDKVAGHAIALVQVPTTSDTGSEGGIRALVTDPAT